MANPKPADSRLRRRARIGGWLGLVLLATWMAPAPARADEPDAIIEQWDQRWTWNADGSCVYWERKHVRLNDERAYDEFADPRITHDDNTEIVQVAVARTKLPDGSYVETPKYGYNMVSPSSAGWPAFASARELVVTMSGVQPGCVTELEYTVTTQPGTWPYITADLRLDHQYPIRQRSVTLVVPADLPLGFSLTNTPADRTEERTEKDAEHNVITRQVIVRDLPGFGHDPQTPPWQESCPRLAFSTAGSADKWLADLLAGIESAADQAESITALAEKWTEDQADSSAKLRAMQDKLSASFNFVSLEVGWGPAGLRSASEMLRSNYGLPAETAAAMLALCRAVGVDARPAVLLPEHAWIESVPQYGWVAGYVLLADGPDGTEIWHPQHGRIQRCGRWNGDVVLWIADGQVRWLRLDEWTDPDQSRCVITGTIRLDSDGGYAGELSLRTTGLFVSAEDLRTSDAQRSRVKELVHRVLPEADLSEFTVETLSPEVFQVQAEIKSSEPIEKIDECYPLVLAEDGPFLADVPMPLAYSERTHPVRLTGPFDERMELSIEWPESWAAEVRPISLSKTGEDWLVEQMVTDEEHGVMLRRHTRVAAGELPADSFLALRGGLNEVRTDGARMLLLKP